MNYNLYKASFIFAISIVCFILPINAEAKIKYLDYHLEYISRVAAETGNVWKRNLIDPLSKIWEPWFNIGATEIYTRGGANKKITEETVEEKNVGEVLSVSVAQGATGATQLTKEEISNWLRDLFLLQQTQNYSNSPAMQATSPVINNYYSSGVTQGLADSVGRSISEINTSLGGGLESLQSNGVFNTSILSVDAVNTRVGVGTSSPSDTLSVNGAVYLAQVSAPSNTSNRLYNTGGNLYWAGNLISSASAGVWETDGTSVWRASGNVGVGTTSPFAKLSIESTAGMAQFVVGSSTATQFIVDKNGNVGVGTASPTHKLNIVDGTVKFFIEPAVGYGTAGLGTSSNHPLILFSNNQERIRINNSGSVGVGTTTPWGLLSVNANGLTSGAPQFVVGSSTATNFIVANNGNVGVGTAAPGFLLHVNGNAMVGATVPTYIPAAPLNLVNSAGGVMKTQLSLVNTGGGNGAGSAIDFFTYDLNGGTEPGLRLAAYDSNYSADFVIFTKVPGNEGNALAERFRVTNAGNVGIGSTTPWRTLSVNGTAAFRGLVNDSTGYYACVNTTTGQLSTSTSACGASSERFKENIQDIGYGLEQVLGLRPVSFDYKANYIPNAPKQLGFIAEEVDLVVPELVARDAAGQIQGLDYPKFTAVLAKAIQELNEKMDAVIAQIQVALAWFTSEGKLKIQNDICVDDVCVTKEQFKQLLLDSAVGATQTIDNSPQIVDDSGEEESGEVEMASSTPEIIPDTPEENASTTPETTIEMSTETASTTAGTE